MSARSSMAAAVACLVLMPWIGQAQDLAPGESRASLPLGEVLRLYRDSEKAQEKKSEDPPTRATVESIQFTGRLLDRSLDISASLVVTILEDDEWVAVPLFKKTSGMNLVDLPDMAQATLAVIDEQLALVARKAGTYRFALGLSQAAESDGLKRVATIDVAEATAAVFRLTYDTSSFGLRTPAAHGKADERVIFPTQNRFTLEWNRLVAGPPADARESQPAPPAEPVITRAHASAISTLEGRRIVRVLFEFKVQGTQGLRCQLGPGQVLQRLFLNGSAVSFETRDSSVEVLASPTRSGGDQGTLEILVAEDSTAYHLAGELAFTVPTVSWPLHELYLTLHLPEVFNYSWISGSLEPIESPPAVHFVHDVPTPGKRLAFHQYLVAESAPRLTLAYTVDLEGQYYRP